MPSWHLYYKRVEVTGRDGEPVAVFQFPDGSTGREDSDIGRIVELRANIANGSAVLVPTEDEFPPESLLWRTTPRTEPMRDFERTSDGRIVGRPAPTSIQRIHHEDRSAEGGAAVEIAPTPTLEGIDLPSLPRSPVPDPNQVRRRDTYERP